MKYGTRQGFFPPSWAPLGFQLTACESQQPFRPASRSASSCKGWYPPIAHCRWSAGTWLSFPSLLPLQDAAEPGCPPQQLSHYTSGRSFCITALLFLPRFTILPVERSTLRAFMGSAWPTATPERGRREFPSFSPAAGQPRWQRSGPGGRQGAPTTRSARRYRPRHLPARLPWGIYLCQICKP